MTESTAARRGYGPLAYLLKSRTYLGEMGHKGEWFAGEHEPQVAEARIPIAGSIPGQVLEAREPRRVIDLDPSLLPLLPVGVSAAYLVFLSVIGGLMLVESVRTILRRRRGGPTPPRRDRRPVWLYGLPLKMRFPRSRLYISVIPPLALGAFVGVLSAIMGVGGGFILVPAMVYVLRMPAGMVVGTSLMQIIVTAGLTGVLQAGRNQTVDIVLAALLLLGGIVGAQFGARASSRFRAEELRAILAVIVLVVGLRMGLGLFLTPDEPFVLMSGLGG